MNIFLHFYFLHFDENTVVKPIRNKFSILAFHSSSNAEADYDLDWTSEMKSKYDNKIQKKPHGWFSSVFNLFFFFSNWTYIHWNIFNEYPNFGKEPTFKFKYIDTSVYESRVKKDKKYLVSGFINRLQLSGTLSRERERAKICVLSACQNNGSTGDGFTDYFFRIHGCTLKQFTLIWISGYFKCKWQRFISHTRLWFVKCTCPFKSFMKLKFLALYVHVYDGCCCLTVMSHAVVVFMNCRQRVILLWRC